MTSPSTGTDGVVSPSAPQWAPESPSLLAAALDAVQVLERAGVDFADCFVERSLRRRDDARVRVRDGQRRPTDFRRARLDDAGFGLRAWRGRVHGLVWSENLAPDAPGKACEQLLAALGGRGSAVLVQPLQGPSSSTALRVEHEPWGDFLVERLVDAAMGLEPRISEVRVRRLKHDRRSLLFAANAAPVQDQRSYGVVRLELTIPSRTGLVVGHASMPEPLQDPEALALEAFEHAREQLEAQPAPTAPASVVFSEASAARWLHEVAGHSLEADVLASGKSGLYEGLRVGPEWLHVVDDALQLHAPGGYQQDDEATPAGRTTLIREGVIVSSLYDRYNAAQQGETSTGNGRRASFRDLPLPRISNLIMNEGSDSLADLLGRMGDGVFVLRLGAACTTGGGSEVQLEADRARAVRAGRLAEPLQPFVIAASPRAFLSALQGSARAEARVPAAGICEKQGQRIPTGARAPAMLLEPQRLRHLS